MVVTRKAPVAPVPVVSRTNSAHAVPRTAKAKPPPSALATDSETRDNAAPTPKPPSKSKHKNKNHKKPVKRPSRSFLDYLLYLSFSLFVAYAFTTCPRDQHLSNPLCRSLSQYRVHVLEPFVLPPIRHALTHPSVAPYIHQAEKFERESVRPVVLKTAEITAPYAAAAKHAVWDRVLVPQYKARVIPLYKHQIIPLYEKHILPPYNAYIAPHLRQASPYIKHTSRRLQQGGVLLHIAYTDYVAPASRTAYAFSKPWVVKGYRAVRPHALTLAAHGKTLALLAADKTGEARRTYVDPHVVRIWDKVLELSGVEPRVVTPVVVVPETSSAGTGLAEEPTPVPEATTEVVEATVTPVETPVTAATPSAEEEVSVVASETATPSSAPTEVEQLSSAASVAVESAHGRESPVVEEILSQASETQSVSEVLSSKTTIAPIETQVDAEPKTQTEEAASAASVVIQSAHGRESPVVEEIKASAIPTTEPETDSSYDDFLADISIEEETAAPSDDYDDFLSEFVDDEDSAPAAPPAEETPRQLTEEDKARITAEKRVNLMGRLADAQAAMEALAKEKTKELRKMLVAKRKKGVAVLSDKQTDAGGALGKLKAEGDKYLKGLEVYLVKEVEKGTEGEEAMGKWEKVVKKVEDRLQESILATQAKIRDFHAREKAEEGEEGMAMIQEVQSACAHEQAGIGLELSWLADVTYHDWQKYHDIARVGEKFQTDASAIQAGTHAHPPVDPFVVKVGEVQAELGGLVGALNELLEGFKERGKETFLGADDEEIEAEIETETEPEEPEPEVSILPIDPVEPPSTEPEEEAFDPAQVIIGKSKEQVLEALNKVEVPVHEEL